MGLSGAIIGGAFRHQLAANGIKRHVQLLRNKGFADAQMVRLFRQGHRAVTTKENRSTKDLRPDLEPVHDACGMKIALWAV